MDGRVLRITLAWQMSEPAEILELYCVHCGYNLHGLEGGRCPECGEAFDRTTANVSRIPWMHRHEIGRVRAWWRTVWMATRRQHELARCVVAPAPYADARRFWLINAGLVLLVVLPVFIYGTGELAEGAQIWPLTGTAKPGVFDLRVPWLMGVESAVVRITALIAAVPTIMGVQTYFAGRCGASQRLQDRAAALGLYASGAWIGTLVVGMVLGAGLTAFAIGYDVSTSGRLYPGWARNCIQAGLLPLALCLVVLPGPATWNLIRRLGRLEGFRSLLMAVLLPIVWMLIWVVCGFVYPWCVGLAWLMLKSS